MVSGGNRRNPDAVVEWIPAAILVQFANLFIFCAPSSRVQYGGKQRSSPPDVSIFDDFPDLPRA